MKRLRLTVFGIILATGLFAAGWHFGRSSAQTAAAAQPDEVTGPLFDSYFSYLVISDIAINCIDSGHPDDAKQFLRGHQDGDIIGLDQLWSSEHTAGDDAAERVLARIAIHRTEHPWNYSDALPALPNSETDAAVAAILKRARDKQSLASSR